jgi:hypothetical protein
VKAETTKEQTIIKDRYLSRKAQHLQIELTMDLAHAELTRILSPQNLHAWAVKDEAISSSSSHLKHDDNKTVDQDAHRYYFLDQAGNSSHGDTALHRLLALHATPPAAVHNFLQHAAQHRQLLATTTENTDNDTEPQHDGDDEDDDANASLYSHLTAIPSSPCNSNDHGVTALHVAVHRNSWHVVSIVDCLLQACPVLASMPMIHTNTYPLHVVMGHNLTIQESLLHSLIAADPTVAAKQDSRGDTPLSLLWKNVLRFRWARAWEVNGVVPLCQKGDLSSWMTVISPDQFRDYALTMIAAVCGKEENITWLDVCRTNRCPPLLIRILLEQRKQLPHPTGGCDCQIHHVEGSLLDVDEVGRLPLHLAAAADPVQLDLVLPEVASQLTTVVELVLQNYPPAAAVVDCTGRLPLHYLLSATTATGNSVAPSALLALVKAYPEALTIQDPVSGLYPAQQLAVCSSDCSDSSPTTTSTSTSTSTTKDMDANAAFTETNVVYSLLRTCPDVVTYYRSQSKNTSTSTDDAVMVRQHRCL